MPKYMLLVIEDRDRQWESPQAAGEMMGRMGKFAGAIAEQGKMVGGGPLTGISDAARLRRSRGDLEVTDGPFAETKEVLSGYFVVEAADRAEAVALAGDCPALEFGTVEVREMIDMGGPPG